MRTNRFLTVITLVSSLAAPAAAQSPEGWPTAREEVREASHGMVRHGPGDGPRWHRRVMRNRFGHEQPMLSIALRHRTELALSPQQAEALETLRTDSRRDAIRRDADRRIAEIDLATLRRSDPVDMGKVEAKVREIERLRADGRLTMIRAVEQGKAQLTAEQREKLKALLIMPPPHMRSRAGGGTPPIAPKEQQ